MCASAAVGAAGSTGVSSIGTAAPALARLRHFDGSSAQPAARYSGSPRAASLHSGSPRASSLRAFSSACSGSPCGGGAQSERSAPSRLGGPLECSSLDWSLEGSWRERFRHVPRRSELLLSWARGPGLAAHAAVSSCGAGPDARAPRARAPQDTGQRSVRRHLRRVLRAAAAGGGGWHGCVCLLQCKVLLMGRSARRLAARRR